MYTLSKGKVCAPHMVSPLKQHACLTINTVDFLFAVWRPKHNDCIFSVQAWCAARGEKCIELLHT